MVNRKRKLAPDSEDAQDLVSAIQAGEIPREYTAAKIAKLTGSIISKRLFVYTLRSINEFLNYRRRSTSTSGTSSFIYDVIE